LGRIVRARLKDIGGEEIGDRGLGEWG
jgi:hypothetical protein